MSPENIKELNKKPLLVGGPVIYLMSKDIRVKNNPSLMYAQRLALENKLELKVYFNLYADLSVRSYQHFAFMIKGIEEVSVKLAKLNIPLVVSTSSEKDFLTELRKNKPCILILDHSSLKHARKKQQRVAERLDCKVVTCDGRNIIPVWYLSDKEEHSARTIRPKINKLLPLFIYKNEIPAFHSYNKQGDKNLINCNKLLAKVKAKHLSDYKPQIIPGEDAALDVLGRFVNLKLDIYQETRSDPTKESTSLLSAYLHFGMISPLTIYSAVKDMDNNAAFIEELVVRRELADNYCYNNHNYDNLKGAKDWAQKTLIKHLSDRREFVYELQEFESASTHDKAWNAAQTQMLRTGFMHGYMRMYWCKKILEWSSSAETAIQTAIYLNDKYQLDGLDSNGYTGIMWSIAGIHDRPWFEREVYGSIRYMNFNGLKRKFNIDSYISKWLPKQS